MLKKKFLNFSHILLWVLSLGLFFTILGNSSNAMTKSEAFEYCRDNSGFASLFSTSGTSSNSGWYSYDGYKSYLDSKTQDIFYVYKPNNAAINNTSATFEINFYDNIVINGDTFTVTNNTYYAADRKTVNQASYLNFYRVGNGGGVNAGTYNLTFPNYQNSFYMLYANGEIIKASFELPPTGLQFTTSTDYITVNIGNETKTDVIRVHKKSTIENPIWGIIQNYNDLDTWLLYYGMYLVMPDGTEYPIQDPYLEFMNNEQRYVRSKGLDIEIGKLYKLEITYEENLESYYYFIDDYFNPIPTGSTITYDYTSGDVQYTIQDQMQQEQNNQDELMGFLTSSEVASGDQPTLGDISVPVFQDDTEDFFTWLMNSVLNILYDNTDSTLEIPLYNTTHYIRSDVYKFNIEPLKSFIQAGWWFIVGVPVLKYIRRSIERLKGGELPATDDKSDLLGNIL